MALALTIGAAGAVWVIFRGDLASAMRLAVADNTTRLCAGDWTMMSVSSAPAPCRAQITKRLSPAEVAALPARDRP